MSGMLQGLHALRLFHRWRKSCRAYFEPKSCRSTDIRSAGRQRSAIFGCDRHADIASIRGNKLVARANANRGRIVAISARVSR